MVWANAYFYRHTQDIEDSSYGTQQILTGPTYQVTGVPAQPYLWIGDRFHDQVTSEARFSFDPIHNWSGTFGLYYSNTHSRFTIPPTYANGLSAPGTTSCSFGSPQFPCTVLSPAWPTNEIWQQTNPGTEEDKSIFGEAYYKFLQKWTLTLGLRGTGSIRAPTTPPTVSSTAARRRVPRSPTARAGSIRRSRCRCRPPTRRWCMRLRPRGSAPVVRRRTSPACSSALPVSAITNVRSDTLWTYELGTKVQLPNVLISAAAYDIEWSNLQQQIALPCGFYVQVNGNKARVDGGEIEANGTLVKGLSYRLGLGYEKTDITDPGALSFAGVTAGTRVSGVPAFTGSVGGVYTKPLSDSTDGFVSADYSYTGNSISLLVGGGGAEATRAGFSLVNLRFGVAHGLSELALNVHNLFNAKPNLGDIGYIGYAQFNAAGTVIPQVATLQPLTVTLQYTKSIQ